MTEEQLLEEWESLCKEAQASLQGSCPLADDEVTVKMGEYVHQLQARVAESEMLMTNFGESVRRIAFEMPAPNEFTPRLVMLTSSLPQYLSRQPAQSLVAIEAQIEAKSEISSMRRDQIDQLQARVHELEGALSAAAAGAEIIAGGTEFPSLRATLNRTPPQSLAAHDARVLRDAAEELCCHKPHHKMTPVEYLRAKADRIEKEGKV